jgi:hypothetical protein
VRWMYRGCRDETQTVFNKKPIRFRLANDWISQAC